LYSTEPRPTRAQQSFARPTHDPIEQHPHAKEKAMATIKKSQIKMPEINADVSKAARDIAAVAKDATYVVIGAGVLGFQQAQVQRHELMRRLSDPKVALEDRVAAVRTDLGGALHTVDTTVESLAVRFEEIIERLEAAVAPLEDRLPGQARDLAKQAHVQAKEARTQLRSRIPTAAA
jgi:exonuclease VII small subunit